MAPSLAAPPRIHPLHAMLLGFPVSLFATALANDVTYLRTAEMQWSNFASWAIVGALVFGAPALLWGLVGGVRGRGWLYPLLLALAWVAGLVNAFKHSQDAWSSVGTAGLLLSIVSTFAAVAAAWVAFSAGGRAAR